jgi:energy-coupling factor transporter ATP-binding protein EcfA2
MGAYAPNDRISFVGKSGSGKTTAAICVACALVPHSETGPDDGWEIWWIDSCQKEDDIKTLKQWGFDRGFNTRRGRRSNRRLLTITEPDTGDKDGIPLWQQCDDICKRALKRRRVLLCVDEYSHVKLSTRRTGPQLGNVHKRGRGLGVGLLGLTQEPVEIPRQLLSQAVHLHLHDVSYPADIKYAKTLYAGYGHNATAERPDRPPHPHGFYSAHIDGAAIWTYYRSIGQWQTEATGDRSPTSVKSRNLQPTSGGLK